MAIDVLTHNYIHLCLCRDLTTLGGDPLSLTRLSQDLYMCRKWIFKLVTLTQMTITIILLIRPISLQGISLHVHVQCIALYARLECTHIIEMQV